MRSGVTCNWFLIILIRVLLCWHDCENGYGFLNLNCIKVHSNSLKMSNVGKFPWNWIPKDRTRVKENRKKNQRLLKTGFHDRYDRCDHSDHSDHMETTFQRSQRQRSLRENFFYLSDRCQCDCYDRWKRVSPKNLAPFRTLPQPFSTVFRPI